MEYVGSLATFAGIMTLSAISLGPNFVIVSTMAMRDSRRAGLSAGLGLAAATLTWSIVAISSLGLLLSHSRCISEGVRIAGALYLILIGIKMLLGARKPLDLSASGRPAKWWKAAKSAYLVSMGNPKTIAFYGSIFTLVVPPNAPLWFDVSLITTASVISVTWYCGVALLFSKPAVRRGFARIKTTAESVMGLLLIGLGGRLLAQS